MRNTPAVIQAQAKRRRQVRIGVVVITIGVVLFIIIVGLTAGDAAQTSDELGFEQARSEQLSDGYGDLAARVAAVCAAGGPDVALDQAQICPLAEAAVANPDVSTGTLTREEVAAIAQAAIAAQAADNTVDMDAIVASVLAAVRSDQSLDGVDEATVRSIVEAALAAQPVPADGDDGDDGRDGSSFEGFRRDDNGNCVAVISTVSADGSRSVATQPAGDAACPPVTPSPDPDPPADPDPDPVEPDPVDPGPAEPNPALPTPDADPQPEPLFTE